MRPFRRRKNAIRLFQKENTCEVVQLVVGIPCEHTRTPPA